MCLEVVPHVAVVFGLDQRMHALHATCKAARCMLHFARCMLHGACCILHGACCTVHVARCASVLGMGHLPVAVRLGGAPRGRAFRMHHWRSTCASDLRRRALRFVRVPL